MTKQNYLSVSALSKYLSKKFEVDPYLKKVFVKGEISNVNNRRQGTQYFNLKDESAIISVICFKRLQFTLEEGMQVLIIGEVKLSEKYGNYKLHVEHIEVTGDGVLFQKYQQLKEQLKAEGLFDLPKKEIVKFPKRIAIITSQSGAVIHDIQTTVSRRFPIVQLDVFPTVVQGEKSVNSIVTNFQRIAQSSVEYDTVIVARGGGSIEDLWSFNEERVVRAIAACPYPVISSIGHETDTTLSDFVSDLRMPTPTAAAEAATPVLTDIKKTIQQLQHRLTTTTVNKLRQLNSQYVRVEQSYIFKQPERLYDSYIKKHEQYNQQLTQYSVQFIKDRLQLFEKMSIGLKMHSPMQKIDNEQAKLQQYSEQLLTRQQAYSKKQEQAFALLVQKLDLLSPLNNMARGYSIVLKDDHVMNTITQFDVNDTIKIEMSDGTLHAQIKEIQEKKR